MPADIPTVDLAQVRSLGLPEDISRVQVRGPWHRGRFLFVRRRDEAVNGAEKTLQARILASAAEAEVRAACLHSTAIRSDSS